MKASTIKTYVIFLFTMMLWLAGSRPAVAQAVAVTARLDTNLLSAGQITTLHVLAQVVPGLRTNSAQIFSWYVDVLNTNGVAASANYNSMTKTASDNDPQTSSKGFNDGANRRAIYDTFLNLPGAGVTNPVELMSIPVTGVTSGKTRFLVQAGTGASLSYDFQVVPSGGGAPYTGGDYTSAFADLTVTNSAAPCVLSLAVKQLSGSAYQLSFTPCPGRTHTVEFIFAPTNGAVWQALSGGPFNSGLVTITNTGQERLFRVRAN
jgi:hypothetical protein